MTPEEKDRYIENDLMELEPDTLRYMVADLTAALQQTETLRDRFAMAAMQALLSNPEYSVSRDDAAKYGSGDAVTAHYAYLQADAMLEARVK